MAKAKGPLRKKSIKRLPSPEEYAARHGLVVDAETSMRLGRIRQKGTSPEQQTQEILRSLGFSFETNNRDLVGSPDAANREERWAVFVHGCYWHAHRRCPRATIPKRNRDFWLAKFSANRARDARVLRTLRKKGFRALVVWECQLRKSPFRVKERLARLLEGQRMRVAHGDVREPRKQPQMND